MMYDLVFIVSHEVQRINKDFYFNSEFTTTDSNHEREMLRVIESKHVPALYTAISTLVLSHDQAVKFCSIVRVIDN